MTLTPTSEQSAVIEASRSGTRRLKIEALAGTGKTTTLVELAKDLKVRRSRQRTLYVAFNRFVVEDVASKVGRFADAMTVNSLALRMVGRDFQVKLAESPKRLSRRQAADLLGITSDLAYTANVVERDGSEVVRSLRISRDRIADMVGLAVRRFCASLGREIDETCFASSTHLGPLIGEVPIPMEVNRELALYARRYWQELCDAGSRRFRFGHEHYMKMWHLSDPVIPYDTVLFDEAQDADPLMRDVVERHQGDVVWCGDRFQAIYGWRGAVNAMQEVVADETLYLTKSFRFSSPIADVANLFLGPLGGVQVEGSAPHQSIVSECGSPDVEIFRTNVALIERFMDLARAGIAVRTDVGLGEYERIVVGLIALREGKRPRHAELGDFASLSELNDWLRDSDVEDDEFRLTLRKLLRHDLDELLDALVKARSTQDHGSGRLLSTAHKSKGLGFSKVVVMDDFPVFSPLDRRVAPEDLRWIKKGGDLPQSWKGGAYVRVPRAIAEKVNPDKARTAGIELWWRCPPREEWQLAYVAVTRAIHVLDHPFQTVDQFMSLEVLDTQTTHHDRPVEVVHDDQTAEHTRPSDKDQLYWSDQPDVTVAGTSYCQDVLAILASGKPGVDGHWPIMATITRQPDNPYDKNAVVVTVRGQKVGFIPKELAPRVGSLLGRGSFEVPGTVVGGYLYKGERAMFGVRLRLGWG